MMRNAERSRSATNRLKDGTSPAGLLVGHPRAAELVAVASKDLDVIDQFGTRRISECGCVPETQACHMVLACGTGFCPGVWETCAVEQRGICGCNHPG
jgi:hypothetical protein